MYGQCFGSFRDYPFIWGGFIFNTLYTNSYMCNYNTEYSYLYSCLLSSSFSFMWKIRRNVLKKLHSALVLNDATSQLQRTWNGSIQKYNQFVSRVGLNLISQHIILRGKANKYALFCLNKLILETWGHFEAKFHLHLYSTVHKAAGQQRLQLHTSRITQGSQTILSLKRCPLSKFMLLNFTHLKHFISIWVQENHFS
jgi:hypothetical protein